jgi:signal transduction histidine kinase
MQTLPHLEKLLPRVSGRSRRGHITVGALGTMGVGMGFLVTGALLATSPWLLMASTMVGGLLVSQGRAIRTLQDEIDAERTTMSRSAAHAERLAVMGIITAGVAHDLRGPLTGLSVAIDELKHPETRMDGELLDDIELSTTRIRELVEDLTRFSRKDGGPGFSHAEQAARTAKRLLGHRFSSCCQIDLAGLPAVSISDQRLTQVLMNLLINATSVADRIAIHGEVDGGGVHIHVDDNGPGVPDTLREDIFEAFVSHREDDDGTGLGLYLCRLFVEEVGGHMEVGTSPMGGARFTLTLPPEGVSIQSIATVAAG